MAARTNFRVRFSFKAPFQLVETAHIDLPKLSLMLNGLSPQPGS